MQCFLQLLATPEEPLSLQEGQIAVREVDAGTRGDHLESMAYLAPTIDSEVLLPKVDFCQIHLLVELNWD